MPDLLLRSEWGDASSMWWCTRGCGTAGHARGCAAGIRAGGGAALGPACRARRAQVREGQLATAEGVSYLEAKHLLLLHYCACLVFYFLLKAEGRPVRDHPVIARLVRAPGQASHPCCLVELVTAIPADSACDLKMCSRAVWHSPAMAFSLAVAHIALEVLDPWQTCQAPSNRHG